MCKIVENLKKMWKCEEKGKEEMCNHVCFLSNRHLLLDAAGTLIINE